MSKIDKYLPPKRGEIRSIQGNVQVELFDAADKYRKEHDLTWNELVTALLLRLVDENKRKTG